MSLPPLPLDKDHWRRRWLMMEPHGRKLHRVSEIKWNQPGWGEEMISGHGYTVCHRDGVLRMPGVLSRLHVPRCKFCCAALGIPYGNGTPYNEGMDA